MISNASTANRIATLWLLSSFVFAAGALFFFPCLCGHLGFEALPASVAGAATVAVPLLRTHLRQAVNPSLTDPPRCRWRLVAAVAIAFLAGWLSLPQPMVAWNLEAYVIGINSD